MEVLPRRVSTYIVTKHAVRPDVAWPIPRQRASFGAVVAVEYAVFPVWDVRIAFSFFLLPLLSHSMVFALVTGMPPIPHLFTVLSFLYSMYELRRPVLLFLIKTNSGMCAHFCTIYRFSHDPRQAMPTPSFVSPNRMY